MYANLGTVPPWLILGFGLIAGWVKNFWSFLYEHTIGWLLTKVRIEIAIEENGHAEAYGWINLWVEKKLRQRKITSMRLEREQIRPEDEEFIERSSTGYSIVPNYGTYYFVWKNRLLVFNSVKEKESTEGLSGANRRPTPFFRTVSMTLWGTRDRTLLLDILSEAKAEFETINPRHMRYYTHGIGGWWEASILVNRPIDTVYLPDRMLEDIKQDFRTFYRSEKKYRSLGIPWRRGWLFEGPPGGGKSTMVQALSSEFKIPIYYLNLTPDLTANDLIRLVRSVRPPSILLIEDADCIGVAQQRDVRRTDRDSHVSDEPEKKGKSISELQTSDLLNVIDGLVASEQRILIMTTNHPQELDKALLREGRIDRRFHFDYAEDTELRRFYDRAREFYPLDSWKEFREALPERCTLADAQGLVFRSEHSIVVSHPDEVNHANCAGKR